MEILGEADATSVANLVPPDEEISWQLYVPPGYSAENPPGVLVYVSPNERGGSPKAWNEVLIEKNLISIGVNGTDGDAAVSERMLKAIIAPLVLQRDYVVDMERCYIAGFSNGGAVATLVTTARPEQFKGGLYISGSVFWGDQAPPKLEQIRQNRHVFMAGTYDKMLKDMKRVHANYKKAGVESAKLITTRDFREWQGPPSDYVNMAIEFLDDRN
jgi:predicted alpha/beta superfamily hydrolase